jgi:ribonuclease T1
MHFLARWITVLALAVATLAAPQLFALGKVPADQSAPAIPDIAPRELPPEARATLALIDRGGPFPYDRDGIVFHNFEKRLPLHERGYYREYTVRTPGVNHRGARRVVAGGGGELYYTDDHYQTFKRIRR